MNDRDPRRLTIGLFTALLGASGCTKDSADPNAGDDGIGADSDAPSSGDPGDSIGEGTGSSTGRDPGEDAESTTEPPPPSPVVWDVGDSIDVPGATCGAPTAVSCDHEDDDIWHAMGINCDVGPQVDGVANGDPLGFYVHAGNLGSFEPAPFPPREGEKFLVISSGQAADIAIPNLFASTDITGFVDNDAALPAPIDVQAVSATDDCTTDPSLIGQGDCSNTIQAQWAQGSGANDYVEMRFTAEVPFETFSFSYDFAMFSTEYPVYYQSSFNDMYIGWLESELWTGNISFDEMGRPISLNAGFLDYKDAPNPVDCPAPCQAPELAGTAMVGHAGTKWLTTTAGVTPGEEITVIFAVFDLSDGVLDTVILLDNFQWGCEGGAPVTIPG
jgi:hypothetical protein